MDVTIEGRAAHASMPEKGLNAISAMADFINLLNRDYIPILNTRYQEKVGSPTVNYGIIQGGRKINVVADKCLLKIDRRWIASEKDIDLISEVEPYLKEACKSSKDYKYKIVSTLPKDGYYGPFYIPENHSFINTCMDAFRKVGLESEVTGMQGWTDGATILNKGYPTLIIGPGSMDVAHTAGEFIQISELINAVKFYLSLIFEICVE